MNPAAPGPLSDHDPFALAARDDKSAADLSHPDNLAGL
jgi:hypothetical protein